MSILHQCIGIAELRGESNTILLEDTTFKAVLDEKACTLSVVDRLSGADQVMYQLSKENVSPIKRIMETCIQYYIRPRIAVVDIYKPVFQLATTDFGEIAELCTTQQDEVVIYHHRYCEEVRTYTPWGLAHQLARKRYYCNGIWVNGKEGDIILEDDNDKGNILHVPMEKYFWLMAGLDKDKAFSDQIHLNLISGIPYFRWDMDALNALHGK